MAMPPSTRNSSLSWRSNSWRSRPNSSDSGGRDQRVPDVRAAVARERNPTGRWAGSTRSGRSRGGRAGAQPYRAVGGINAFRTCARRSRGSTTLPGDRRDRRVPDVRAAVARERNPTGRWRDRRVPDVRAAVARERNPTGRWAGSTRSGRARGGRAGAQPYRAVGGINALRKCARRSRGSATLPGGGRDRRVPDVRALVARERNPTGRWAGSTRSGRARGGRAGAQPYRAVGGIDAFRTSARRSRGNATLPGRGRDQRVPDVRAPVARERNPIGRWAGSTRSLLRSPVMADTAIRSFLVG